MDQTKVYQFPVSAAARGGARWWQRITARAKVALGRALARLGVPGAVAAVEIRDSASGNSVTINVGPLFTRVQVNGRDFYFDRFTGKLDGTGSGCA